MARASKIQVRSVIALNMTLQGVLLNQRFDLDETANPSNSTQHLSEEPRDRWPTVA
jgi:hypothetical protein